MKKAILATAITATVASPVVQANADPMTIVITASRFEQNVTQSLAPVTVITQQQLKQSQPKSVAQALQQAAGIQIVNSGGYGQTSNLYMRGLDQKRMLVLVDGVQVGSATLGTASLEHFPLDQIERIEVVRGARSSLYGSNAIAGVVQVFTKKAKNNQNYAEVEAGAGSDNARQLGVNGGWANEDTRISASVSHFKTDGFDVWDKEGEDGEDDDGYTNNALKLSAEHQLDQVKLFAGVQHNEGENDYDQCSKPDWSKTNDCVSLFENTTTHVGAQAELSDDLNLRTQLSHHKDSSQQEVEGVKADKFVTKNYHFSLQSDYSVNDNHTLVAGIDYKQDKISGSGVSDYQEDQRDNKALFGLWQWQQSRFTSSVSGRIDDNEAFGSFDTFGVEVGVELIEGLQLTAGRASAFTAPTFNDLYAPDTGFTAGNPDVDPETSDTNSLGLSYQITPALYTALNVYQTDVDDMIIWAPDDNGKWMPSNVESVEIKGAELSAQFQHENTQIQANIEWLDAENAQGENRGKQLIYRAKNKATLRVAQQIEQFTLGASATYIGERYADSANTDKLSGYTLLDLDGQYQVNRDLSLKMTVKNLTDKDYVSKRNYATEGRSVFGSVSYRF